MQSGTDRHEFRAFARNFGIVEERLRARLTSPRLRESDELYIVGAGITDHNVKVRDNQIDIKVLRDRAHDMERWMPALKTALPVADAQARRQLIAALGAAPELGAAPPDMRDAVEQWVRSQPGLVPARVFKRRLTGIIDDCLCEMTEVSINGAWCMTACVESVDWRTALALVCELGLDAWPNENYVQAIRRVTGLVPMPVSR